MPPSLAQRAAAETKCPRCSAEPMHPCREPSGRARSVHAARVSQRRTDEAMARVQAIYEAVRDRDCPSCRAPAGETCRLTSSTCPERLDPTYDADAEGEAQG